MKLILALATIAVLSPGGLFASPNTGLPQAADTTTYRCQHFYYTQDVQPILSFTATVSYSSTPIQVQVEGVPSKVHTWVQLKVQGDVEHENEYLLIPQNSQPTGYPKIFQRFIQAYQNQNKQEFLYVFDFEKANKSYGMVIAKSNGVDGKESLLDSISCSKQSH